MHVLHAQGPDFSQNHTNYVYMNPAFAGMQVCPRAYMAYRAKYSDLNGGYTSTYTSYDMSVSAINSDVGVALLHDVQGNNIYNTTFYGMYGKSFEIKKRLYLKMAAEVGAGKVEISDGALIFSDMIDTYQGVVRETSENLDYFSDFYFDSEFGALLYSDVFYLGIDAKHLNHFGRANSESGFVFAPEFSLHAGGKVSSNKSFIQRNIINVYPKLNVTISKVSSYMHLGAIVQKNQLQLGLGYRQNIPIRGESFVLFVGFVEKKFKFAYTCDVIIKTDLVGSFSTHEVSLAYQFDCLKKQGKYKAVIAPMN